MGTVGYRGPRVEGGKTGMWEGTGSRTLLILDPCALGYSNCSRDSALSCPLSPINSIRINSIQQAFIEYFMFDTFSSSWRPSIASLPLELSPVYYFPDSGSLGPKY